MKNLHHPNVVAMRAFWKDSTGNYMLFDYAMNGDLSKFLREHAPLDIDTTRFLLAHIINGLEYLRSKNLLHRDLKPANIVLNEQWVPKLADFGTAKKYEPFASPVKPSEASEGFSCSAGGSYQMSAFSASGVSNVSAGFNSANMPSVDNTSALSQ